jgi:hypothetical protein
VPHERRGPKIFKIFSRIFQVRGGVTSLGGRTTWGRGKEWEAINGEWSGDELGVTWRVREGTPTKRRVHHPF